VQNLTFITPTVVVAVVVVTTVVGLNVVRSIVFLGESLYEVVKRKEERKRLSVTFRTRKERHLAVFVSNLSVVPGLPPTVGKKL
jgi:hypothetical protein